MTWEEAAHPRGEHGKWTHLTAGLDTHDFEGRVGDPNHITRRQTGTLPVEAIKDLLGKAGEVPGAHRNKQGPKWDEFKDDVAKNGVQRPIFITVDHGEEPKISEGNHRRDAAVETGQTHVPVEITYFGHAEQEGGHLDPAHNDTPPDRSSDWGREADDSREYAGLHQPNNAAPLHDLTSTETVPDDFYTHMHYYQYGDPEHDRESARAIKAAHGQPDRPVTVYRAAPAGVTHINPGDWVTLSRKYAEQHAMQDNDPSHDWPVHEAQVPAKHVGWDGNDINEFGYFGDEPVPVSGRQGITSAGRLQAGGGMVADEPTPTTTLAGTCSGPGPCDVHPFGHGKNWVNKVGGLPEYIRAIAHALARQGHSESAAIATAVATVKRWAAGGGKVKPDTRARAAKAVAEWEAKKAAASIDDAESFALGVAEDDTAVETPDVSHAGLAVKAADTGRVLMLQRGIDTPGDEAAGKWEFPGGGLEPDDTTTLHGAVREWQEEVGQPLPKGGVVAETWTAPNGIYQGHVVVIPEEKAVTLHEGRQLLNPDDPHGGGSEQVAWWDPDDAALNPALREEVKSTPWDLIKGAGEGATPAGDDEEESPAGRATPDVFSMVEFLSAFDDEFGDDEEFAWWDAYAKPPAVKAKKKQPKQQAASSQGGSGFNAKHPRDPFGKFAPLGQGAGYTSDQKGQRENTQVKAVQKMLQHLGISVGPEGVDGMLGPHTRHAIEDFQQRHGLGVNGVVDRKTLEAMKVAAHVKGSAAKAQKAQAKATRSTRARRPQHIPGLRAQAPGMLPDSAIPRQPVQVSMPGYRPNPIVADGTSFEGVPAITLTQPADPGAEFAEDRVYHYKHGWIPTDHPAAKRGTGLIKKGNLLHRDGEVHEITGVSGEKVRIKSQSTGKVRHLPLSEARHSPVRRPTDKAPEAVQYPAMDDLIKRMREHGLAVDEASLGEALDVADMSFAVEDGDVFASSNRWIRKRGNKWVIIQKGTGKVLQSHDSQEQAERGFRAMMKSKYGGQVSDTEFDLDEGAFASSHEGHVYHFKHGWIPVGDYRDEGDHGLTPHEHHALSNAMQVHGDNVSMSDPADARKIDEAVGRLEEGDTLHGQHDLHHTHNALTEAADASAREGDMRHARVLDKIKNKLHQQEHGDTNAREATNFAALVAAAVTEQSPIELGEDVGGGVPFKIPLVLPTGIETGDRREFKAGGVSSRDLPIPLLWQRFTDDGHKQASIVGRIDKIEPTKNGLGNAEGVFDTGVDATEALRLVRGLFLRGVSGDVDKIDAEMSQGDDGKPKVMFDKGRLTAATLVAKPAFAECMIELPGDKEWESNMGRLREEGGAPKPLVAAGGPMNPPKEWFQDPGLTEPTHLEVTDDGRVFGHIAAWNQDHIGMPFQKPPRSNSGYRYFTTGQVKTAEGDLINVGQLTLAGGHADLSYTADMAVKHYDDTNSAVADVAIGEDAFGIWVAGAQRPDLSEAQVRTFRASDPSGDWRPINGNLELVACLQVNVPGFPIPRARVASGAPGQQPVITALVAAGAPAIARRHPTYEATSVLEARVASLEQADTRRRAAIASELRATVAAGKAMLIKQTKQALVASADDLAQVEFDSPIFDADPDAGSEDMSGTETDEVSTAK